MTSTALNRVLDKLPDARRNGKGWQVCCPAHDDRKASLCIGQGDDGRALVHCQAGCDTKDVVLAIGLTMADLMPSKNGSHKRGKIIAEYDYLDEQGKLLFQAVRLEPKDFRQRKPNGKGGWSWTTKDVRIVPYRLPELLAKPNDPVFIPEGERDVNRLLELGLLATCNHGGSGKWKAEHAEFLRGRNVAILPDNDEPGRKHAEKVAETLQGIAKSVRIVTLPDLPEKGDVSDWLDTGGDVDTLCKLANAAKLWTPTREKNEGQSSKSKKSKPKAAIENYHYLKQTDTEPSPQPLRDTISDIKAKSNGWPRRVGNALFVCKDGHVDWLESTSSLFGWLHGIGDDAVTGVRWKRGEGYVTKEELFAELTRTSEAYRAIEELPHEPTIEGHYYTCPTVEPGDGDALHELLERFEPATPVDRDLILSAFFTTAWGGPTGCRPCYVITSDHGRGAGKSTVANMIGQLWGGILSFSPKEDIGKIKTRLLSPDALTRRVCLLDNVKSPKFSWGDLEALITAPIIGGHRLFCGEGTRPNTLTWFITLNGASLSTDMAQRAVIIKVKKPKRSATWEEDTRRFIEDNRLRIIADIVTALRCDPFTLSKFTRWATWEKDILQRLPDPEEAQQVILERQDSVDVEADEAGLLEEFFAEQLSRLTYNSEHDQVFIPSGIAARWWNWCHNENVKTTGASRAIGQLIDEGRLKRLIRNKCNEWGRGFVWFGQQSDIGEKVKTDIEERISRRTKDEESKF